MRSDRAVPVVLVADDDPVTRLLVPRSSAINRRRTEKTLLVPVLSMADGEFAALPAG